MTLIQKLRYMGKQYAAGQENRGGGRQKHYLEEAADEIDRLRGALEELVALKDLKDRLHQLHEMGHGTDSRTGCQYLESLNGGLTPRLDRDGKHVGCR